ncbi:MAG TPA: hypothetical protein VEJ85_04700 [Thermoplasmata archaeon]|nr:hypothetical protein [Thermoplasmata archaeon]
MAAQPASAYPELERPLGVAILAVLVGIFGAILLVAGLLFLVNVAVVAILGIPSSIGGESLFVSSIILIVVGLIILGLALGLWHLRMWALVLTLLFVIFELVSFGLARDFLTFGFIFAFILFVYLLAVHRHFR